VIAQAALSLGLLATGQQFVSTVQGQAAGTGTPADRLLIARFNLLQLGPEPGEAERFYRDLAEQAKRLPGVEAVGVARHTAIWTFGNGQGPSSLVVRRPDDGPQDGSVVIGGYAGGQLFEALGLRVVSGRSFVAGERDGLPKVAIVNEAFERDLGGLAVGRSVRVNAYNSGDTAPEIDVRIVGVVEDVRDPQYEGPYPPYRKIYLPAAIEPEPALALYVRTRGNASATAEPLRNLAARLAPRFPIQEMGSLQHFNELSYALWLWLARAAAFLGVIGLALAAAGLYGLSSYVAAMRSREFAIRLAVGGRPGAVLAMVLGQTMRTVIVGLLIGSAVAVAVSKIVQAGYYEVVGIDSVAFAGAAVLFLGVMLIATAVPALRAARTDPSAILKDG
jgi:hypothetical protein